jgi:ribosomal protein L11 methylase PrmA
MIAEMRCLKPNGVFIASGIIGERLDEVNLALTEAGFEIIETKSANDWFCIVCSPVKQILEGNTIYA